MPEDLLAAALGEGAAPRIAEDDAALVCSCNSVTRETIMDVARDRGLATLEEVMGVTRAATGCGSCAPDVRRLLSELESEQAEDLRYARLAGGR